MSDITKDLSTSLEVNKKLVESMFSVGAHFGYSKSLRHPSTTPYIFGAKNTIEIFDLEKTSKMLEEAKVFVEKVASEGKQILFVSGKREVIRLIKDASQKIDQPYVAGRWIGGTITNFEEIQKRTARLDKLSVEKEKGLLAKYTKKERLLIDREIEKLEARFGGISNMKSKPGAVFVVDVKQEDVAVAEILVAGIPIISLSSSDCDISKINHPILGNDSSSNSIKFVLDELSEAYQVGAKKRAAAVAAKPEDKK